MNPLANPFIKVPMGLTCMADKSWKALERRVASKIGGKRVTEKGGTREDVESDVFIAECKHGKQVPDTIYKWYYQAKKHQDLKGNESKIPLLVIKRPDRILNLVVCDINDLDVIIKWKNS